MGGKSSKTKITRFHMSQWWGIAHTVDAVLRVRYGDKEIWSGRAETSRTYDINKPNLYGGDKKEGGAVGRMTVLMGDPEQIMPDGLAKRLGATSGADVPGFRGVTSLFFTGTAGGSVPASGGGTFIGPAYAPMSTSHAFYWTANSPYLKPLKVTVERIPKQLDPLTAKIPRLVGGSMPPNSDGWEYQQLPYHDNPGRTNLVPPAGGWNSGGVGPFDDNNLWTRTPDLSVFWVRKTVRVSGDNLTLKAAAENGCVLFVNGVVVGASNPDNLPIPNNQDFPVEFPVSKGATYEIVVKAYTESSSSAQGGNYLAVSMEGASVFDANPAHIIFECLTDTTWGLGEETQNLDMDSFKSAAQTLYDERLGVSLLWDAASPIEDFVNNMLSHINGVVFTNPRTGKLTLRLVRYDYDVVAVREINPDNANLTRFSRKAWGDTINELQVTWTNPEEEKPSKVVLQDDGNIAQQGSVNSSNSDYIGVRRVELAWELAERDLRAASSPLSSGEAVANRTFYDVTPMEVVKLNWPEYGVGAVYMRVGSVTYGGLGSSAISMALAEDIFSAPKSVFTRSQTSEWLPSDPSAGDVAATYIMPAPYYGLAATTGDNPPTLDEVTTYLAPLATSEAGQSSTYDLYSEVQLTNAATEFQLVDDERPFMAAAALPATLPGAAVSTIAGLSASPNDVVIAGVPGLPAEDIEIMLVTSVDPDTGAATVWRGVMDTTPKPWASGASIWVGALENMAADPTQRVPGATAMYKFVPGTSDVGVDGEPAVLAVAAERAIFPYPPANLKIGGVDAFDVASASGAFTLTWAHRNKETQAEQILRQDDASVPPTETTRYALSALDGSGNVIVSRGDIAGDTAEIDLAYTGPLTLKLWAVDDSGLSFQAQTRTLDYSAGTATVSTITAPTYVPPDNSVIIDGGEIT